MRCGAFGLGRGVAPERWLDRWDVPGPGGVCALLRRLGAPRQQVRHLQHVVAGHRRQAGAAGRADGRRPLGGDGGDPPGRAGQGAGDRCRGVGVAAHVDGRQHRVREVAVGRRVRAEGEGDGLGGQVGPGVAADDHRGADGAFAQVGRRHRAAQAARRPGVVRDDGQGGGHDRDGRRPGHRRRDARRHRLAAVDALALVADRAVDRHQAGRLGGTARREDTVGRGPHGQSVAPGVAVLGGDGGGQTPAQVLQGAAFAEARAPERALLPVRDPLVPGRLHPGRGERGPVPGQQQAREDRVLGVVGAGRLLGHVSRDAAPPGADLGGLHVLGRRPESVTDGQAQQRAAGPFAEPDGVPVRGGRGNAGGGCHAASPLPLRICPRCGAPHSLTGLSVTRSTSVRARSRMSARG